MDVAEHTEALRREGEVLAAAAERTDLDADIPTCPDWRLRDLVRHVGGVHRWAAWNVSHPSPEPVNGEQEAQLMNSWPADLGLCDWFRAGHAALVETLQAAPPDVACWSFLPAPTPLAFWARRQAHETAIHRADAESASGSITPVPPELGADGLDELLLRFAARRRTLPVDAPRTLSLRATDVAGDWLVQLGPEGIRTTREDGDADCTVEGTASDLYLLLWNRRRPEGLHVRGDTAVLELWRGSMRIRWT
jgi:uncharacterized protein (TIGR03083 family)